MLVLEEHPEIGKPPHCAGILHSTKLKKARINIPGDVVLAKVNAISLYHNTDHVMDIPTAAFYIIDRVAFDKRLAKEAERAGAELALLSQAVKVARTSDGLVVSVKQRGGTRDVTGKIVVGANGFSGYFSRQLGLRAPNDFIVCFQYEARVEGEVPKSIVAIVGRKLAPGGYGWVLPIGDDKVRVGVGVYRVSEPAKHYATKVLEAFFSKYKILEEMGRPLPLTGPVIPFYTDNYVAVGDAAGFVNPASGAGIIAACLSGRAAAEVVSSALEEGNYTKEFLRRVELLLREQLIRPYLDLLKVRYDFQSFDDRVLGEAARMIKEELLFAKRSKLKILMKGAKLALKKPKLAKFAYHLLKLRDVISM